MINYDTCLKQGIEEAVPKISQLAAGRISATSGQSHMVPLHQLADFAGGEETMVTGIAMTLQDSPSIKMLIIMTADTAETMIECIIGQAGLNDEQLAISVLQEIGNIFGTAIVNRLARESGSAVKTSTPEIARDMTGAIISSIICDLPELEDQVAVTNTTFFIDQQQTDCEIFLFTGTTGSASPDQMNGNEYNIYL